MESPDCLQMVVVEIHHGSVVVVVMDTLDCLQVVVVVVEIHHGSVVVVVVMDTLDCLQVVVVVVVDTLDCLRVVRLDRLHYFHMMVADFLLIVFEIYAIHYLVEHFYEQL